MGITKDKQLWGQQAPRKHYNQGRARRLKNSQRRRWQGLGSSSQELSQRETAIHRPNANTGRTEHRAGEPMLGGKTLKHI